MKLICNSILSRSTLSLFCLLTVSYFAQAKIMVPQSVLNMKVTTDGVYRISYSDIMAQGIDLNGVSLSQLSITLNGNNVPIKFHGNTASVFDVNTSIDFVGQSVDTLYQDGIVYTLILAQNTLIKDSDIEPQLNQVSDAYYFKEDTYANNIDYSFGSPIEDPWYSKRLLAIGSQVTEQLDFNLDNMADPVLYPEYINIQISAWGGTDYPQSPDHHIVYEINNTVLGDERFDGVTANFSNYNLSSHNFINGPQALLVKVPNDTDTVADVIHIESWKVTYPRAFVLKQNQIDFDVVDVTTNVAADTLFKDSYEELNAIQAPVATNGLKHYQLQNANNENYLVYKLNPDQTVESFDVLHSQECSTIINTSCLLNFSIENTQGHVYVAAVSELKTPEFSIPVLLTDINQDTQAIDYLIITHPDFIGDELDAFIQMKQQDMTVKLVDVEQIYAQFGYSQVSAQSIADYIQFAASTMAVKTVLLVGGDTYDYNNYLDLNSVSFIPTLYGTTDDLISFAPIDAKYADLDGDDVPDINIGRLPVRTKAELENVTLKIEAYANKTYSNTSVFAADKFDVNNSYSFKNDAELLVSQLPQIWQDNITILNKAYVDDDGVTAAKSKLIDNINQGTALTSFIGHSAPRDWSFSRMFSASDANVLINSTSPTLVTQWGCWNTYFVSPTEDTLAHAFMLNPNGGAASVLGASTLTKAEHEKALAQLVLGFLTHDGLSLGDAVTQAKRIYAQTNPDALDVILGWNILGDPSLRL